jgi:hypothetical protein
VSSPRQRPSAAGKRGRMGEQAVDSCPSYVQDTQSAQMTVQSSQLCWLMYLM